jgi:hypothetical protein
VTTLALPGIGRRVRSVLSVVGGALRKRATPVGAHLRDHGYTIAALACWGAAWFTHSVFSGLLASSLAFVLFELKVSVD